LNKEAVAAHPVVHFEIAGKEAKQTQQFYASLFG
jgi:predicted enzyme related to lactoylglutathione lyase